ncbi:hypothetical protein ABEF95_012375 [Exophiala dermatitidis]
MTCKKPTSSSSTDDTKGPNSNSSSSIIVPVYSQRTTAETVLRNYKPNTPIQNTQRAGKGTDESPYANVPSIDDPVSSQAETVAATDQTKKGQGSGRTSSPRARTQPPRASTSDPTETTVIDPVYGHSMAKDATPNQKTETETGQGVGTISPADDPVYSQQQVEGNRNSNNTTTTSDSNSSSSTNGTIIDPVYGQPRTSTSDTVHLPAAENTPPSAKSGAGSISPADDPVYSQPQSQTCSTTAQDPSSRGIGSGSGIGSRLSQLASQILPRSLLPVSAKKQNPTGSARADPDHPDPDTTGTHWQPKDNKTD